VRTAFLPLAAFLALAGCKRSEGSAGNAPVRVCVDRDRDGIDSCSDCDDGNAAVGHCPDGSTVAQPGPLPQPDGGPTPCGDTLADVNHCGRCDNVCPTPRRAEARCRAGVCGRGPCPSGFFDLDPAVFGCEWRCEGTNCTHDDGRKLALTSAPLPETDAVFQAASTGSSVGGAVQTSPRYTHIGVIGEPTPPTPESVTQRGDGGVSHHGGFGSSQQRRSP
jgi:hypothetical protein